MTLKELEIVTGATLVINFFDEHRITVRLEGADVAEGSCLIGTYGTGRTVTAAKNDYARRIRGKRLVLYAGHSERRELHIPQTLKGD